MRTTGDTQIDQQIDQVVTTYKLPVAIAKMCVLAGMSEEHIAKAAQYGDPFVYLKAWQLAAYPARSFGQLKDISSVPPIV